MLLRVIGFLTPFVVVPAKAGIHWSDNAAVEAWIPAFELVNLLARG
jgi:hypothetical protein